MIVLCVELAQVSVHQVLSLKVMASMKSIQTHVLTAVLVQMHARQVQLPRVHN